MLGPFVSWIAITFAISVLLIWQLAAVQKTIIVDKEETSRAPVVVLKPEVSALDIPMPPFLNPEPKRLWVIATGYTSREEETDSTPFITATGKRVRPGIAAVSRDLLSSEMPYGSRFKIVRVADNPTTCRAKNVLGWFSSRGIGEFEVQDTMHPRKRNQIDIWFPDLDLARTWGRCEVLIEIF